MPTDSGSLKQEPRRGFCVVFVFSGRVQGREPGLCLHPTSPSLVRPRASLLGKELGGLSGLGPSGLGLQAAEGAPFPASPFLCSLSPSKTAIGLILLTHTLVEYLRIGLWGTRVPETSHQNGAQLCLYLGESSQLPTDFQRCP